VVIHHHKNAIAKYEETTKFIKSTNLKKTNNQTFTTLCLYTF